MVVTPSIWPQTRCHESQRWRRSSLFGIRVKNDVFFSGRTRNCCSAHLTNVHTFIRHVMLWLLHLGVFGPLILGILDSSFLFFPFGNDLLVVALTARDHAHLPLYVLTASLGSATGVLLLDFAARKGGEEGLKKLMKRSRAEYLRKRIEEHGAVAVAVAALAPPPFPFTLVIAATSAFQFPRARLLAVAFAARIIRFTLVGLLAVWFGRGILRIVRTTEFEWFMFGFIVLCTVGSVLQVRRWLRHGPSKREVMAGSPS
jgi:membrane protein YqaA with SNARE-associated domain